LWITGPFFGAVGFAGGFERGFSGLLAVGFVCCLAGGAVGFVGAGGAAGVEVSLSRAAICSLVSLSAGLGRPSSESLFLIVLLPEIVKRG
jgi:hypothetical protein